MPKFALKTKYQGIILLLSSALFFAFMNLFVRMAGDLPTMQKVFFRNAVALVCSLAMMLARPSRFKTAKGNMTALIFRAVAGTAGVVCNFYAVDRLSLADASMLNKLSPFFVIIFSILILKEKPGKIDWLAVAAAFAGALFVIRPSLTLEVIPALVGVLGGVTAGLAYTLTRKAARGGADRQLIILIFSALSCLVSAPFLIFAYAPMTGGQLLFLLLAGTAAMLGQLCITAAYSKAPAKDISVFDYSIVIFAALLAFGFVGEVPDALSYIGYAVIIGAAVMKWIYSK